MGVCLKKVKVRLTDRKSEKSEKYEQTYIVHSHHSHKASCIDVFVFGATVGNQKLITL